MPAATTRRVARGATVMVSCALALLLVEAAMRYLLAPIPRVQHIVEDPVLGWDSAPPLTPLTNAGAGETVYFLGDSFTQDRQWPALTQRYAAERGVRFDGQVLGVSGYGTTQSLLKLERDFDRFHPRLVLLLFFAWNDLRDNVDAPAIFYSPTTRTRPYIVRRDGAMTVSAAAPLSPVTWLLYRPEVSRRLLLKALLRVDDRLARNNVDALARWQLPVMVNYTERGTWEPFYTPGPDGDYVSAAYAATEETFRLLQTFVAERGSVLGVIGLDNPFVVDEDVARQWIPSDSAFDPDLPLRRIGDLLARHGIAFVSATPALRETRARLGKKMYNPPPGELSGHLEPEGEEVVARIAADLAVRLLGRRSGE